MWAIIMLAAVAGVAVALLITACIVQARKRAGAGTADAMNAPLVDVESSAASYRRSPDGSLPTRSTMTKSRGDKLK
jgi:hypothetical protein